MTIHAFIQGCVTGALLVLGWFLLSGVFKPARPRIVCLCGSTMFFRQFQTANLRETLAGKIVLTIGCDTKSDGEIFGYLDPAEQQRVKTELDQLHLRKIELADEILVLNVNGYIGASTAAEISHARSLGKPIRWLETPPEVNL